MMYELKTTDRSNSKAEVTGRLQLIAFAYARWQLAREITMFKLVQLVQIKKQWLEFRGIERSMKDLARFQRLLNRSWLGYWWRFYPNPTYGKCRCEYEEYCWEREG